MFPSLVKFTRPSHGQFRAQAPSAPLLFCAFGYLAAAGVDVNICERGGCSIRANHLHLLLGDILLITTAAHVHHCVGLCRVPVINEGRIDVRVNHVNDAGQKKDFFIFILTWKKWHRFLSRK